MNSRPHIGAVVLVAGAGSRMAYRPKSLLELDGKPIVQNQIQALAQAGVSEIVLVLGHYADRIEAALDQSVRDRAIRVRNPRPEAGQVASLRLGLQALLRPADAVLVALGDQPLINAQDIGDLIKAFRERPAGKHMLQPTVDGLPGNPVMFSAKARAEILAEDASFGGQQWKAAHPDQLHRWESGNLHYRQDVDTPEDIAVLAALGHRLSWPLDGGVSS